MELASRDDELENDTNQARWQQVLHDWAKKKQIWGERNASAAVPAQPEGFAAAAAVDPAEMVSERDEVRRMKTWLLFSMKSIHLTMESASSKLRV